MNRKRVTEKGTKLGYEEARANALTRYRIAGTLPEEIFDHYVQMATLIFRIPAAIIAFVSTEMVHYKASIGVGSAEHSIRYGITCAETIEHDNDIHIVDLAKVKNSTASSFPNTSDPLYSYYIGTPIITSDGYTIGCLSLLDHKFRELTAEQHSVLKILASAVMDAVEERLKNLQDRERNQWFSKTTQEGMWEWDIYQDKIWWNSGFSILFGYTPAIDDHNLDYWCSRFDGNAYGDIKETMRTFSLDGEYLFKRADDSPAHVLIRSVIIRDDFGQPVKIIGSMLDISERFKNEELNRKANQDLMRNKDEFISIASHEIKTPITIIKSYSQIIKKEAEKDLYKDTNLKMFADRIQKQSDKLIRLVENLLDVSRINTGKMVIYSQTFDFIKLLAQTLEELDVDMGNHTIEILGDQPLRVYADEFRIGQVLTNLITNAIKYSPGADKVIISYYKNAETNSATVSVKDFGKGVAKGDQEKLFQKFHRIITMHESQISGTGLGLSIAMEIMKQHGSTITLISEEGEGAEFSFELMLSPAFNPH